MLSPWSRSIIALRSATDRPCRARRTKNRSPASARRSSRAASSRPRPEPPPAFAAPPNTPEAPSRSWARHCVIWLGCTSNCWASSASVFSPLMAASATFALKAGLWFRRGRLVMVSPRFLGNHADVARIIHSAPSFRFPSQLCSSGPRSARRRRPGLAVNGGGKTSHGAAQRSAGSYCCWDRVTRLGARARHVAGACQGALARQGQCCCQASGAVFRARLCARR